MDVILLIGRVLFAVLFLYSALGHLTQADTMAGYATARGLPFPKLGVIGSGVVMLAGGLAVLLGIYADLGALALAILMVVTAFAMHHFWSDPADAKQNEQIQFLKDIALAGGAFALYVAVSQVTTYSLGGLFFR